MEPMPDYIDVAVILAVGGLLWRQMAGMDRRLTAGLADLARDVRDVDRRLARLEGRMDATLPLVQQVVPGGESTVGGT